MTGAIKENGFVVISAIDRLSDVIKESGGFLPLSKEFNIEITHQDGTSDNYNYLKYLSEEVYPIEIIQADYLGNATFSHLS